MSANAETAPFGEARQPLPLLLLGAEEPERLRDADGLVRRQERDQVSVHARDELDDRPVLVLREAEAAVFRLDLHAERAERGEAVENALRDLAVAVDRVAVDLVAEEPFHLLVEGAELGPLLPRRKVGDEVEAEAPEKELLQKARLLPSGLARFLGDLAGFAFADGHGGTLRQGASGRGDCGSRDERGTVQRGGHETGNRIAAVASLGVAP